MAAKLYFILCTLYNLHKLKIAANMLKISYYNFNVHTLAAFVYYNIGYRYVMHIYIHRGSHIYSVK